MDFLAEGFRKLKALQTDRHTDTQTHRQTHGHTDTQTDTRTHRHTDRHTDTQTHRQMRLKTLSRRIHGW